MDTIDAVGKRIITAGFILYITKADNNNNRKILSLSTLLGISVHVLLQVLMDNLFKGPSGKIVQEFNNAVLFLFFLILFFWDKAISEHFGRPKELQNGQANQK